MDAFLHPRPQAPRPLAPPSSGALPLNVGILPLKPPYQPQAGLIGIGFVWEHMGPRVGLARPHEEGETILEMCTFF